MDSARVPPRVALVVPLVLILASVHAGVALAQQRTAISPSHAYVLSGYGTAGALYTQDGERTFFTSVAPIFLFQFTDRVLAETELEFELEEGATKTGLEYADISLLLNDYITVTAGKFLLPFGIFGQRLHPTWINRFATNPPVFGGHGGVPGVEGLLPILSDIGVMVGAVLPVGGIGRNVTFSGFLTNGPMAEAMEEGGAGMEEEHVPELAFGESVEDNNKNKMIGGRLGLVLAPHFELDLSGMRAAYGDVALPPNAGTQLHLVSYNAAAEYRVGNVEIRTEWLRAEVDVEEADTMTMSSEIELVKRWGGYAQATYRLGSWEPVFRFSRVDPNEAEADDELSQYGFGLNYYLTPSISVMAGFELNRDRLDMGNDMSNNRLVIYWAFGF